MIYLLPDDFLGHERLAEIRRACGDPDLVSLNTTRLEGQRLDLDELAAAAMAMPFLAEKRLVVVRQALSQYDAKGAAAGSEKRQATRSERARALVAVLEQLPPTTELVFLEEPEKVKKSGNPIAQAISRLGGEVMERRQMKPDELIAWASNRVRAKGGRIQPGAAALLATAAGDDLQRLDGEIEKLITYAAGAEIKTEDVRLLVSAPGDDNVFHLVDAVGRGDRRQALAVLREAVGAGAAVPYLLLMIVRQFRLLLQARELSTTGLDPWQIAGQLRVPSWVARTLVEQTRRFRDGDLERIYRRLVETDQAIKTGRLEGGVALDLLVAELTARRGADSGE